MIHLVVDASVAIKWLSSVSTGTFGIRSRQTTSTVGSKATVELIAPDLIWIRNRKCSLESGPSQNKCIQRGTLKRH